MTSHFNFRGISWAIGNENTATAQTLDVPVKYPIETILPITSDPAHPASDSHEITSGAHVHILEVLHIEVDGSIVHDHVSRAARRR
jgi:hypothetical protein